jgi:hypothetical protein
MHHNLLSQLTIITLYMINIWVRIFTQLHRPCVYVCIFEDDDYMEEQFRVWQENSNEYNITIHHIQFDLHSHLPIQLLHTIDCLRPSFTQ